MSSIETEPFDNVGGGRRSRRSWFDAPPLTSLNPLDNQQGHQSQRPAPKSKRKSLDTVENLTLTHFTAAPRIGFSTIILGRTKIKTLLIRNPHDYEQDVIIEKFPFKKKFTVETTRFTVEPNEVFSLEITWTPEEVGGVREMIQFHINGVYRLQAFLFGTVEKPKLARKVRRPGLGPRVKQSNTLCTPALASIKASYSPQRCTDANEVDVDNDKENTAMFVRESHENKYMVAEAQSAVVQRQGGGGDPVLKPAEVRSKFMEKYVVPSTPTPLESTTILPKLEPCGSIGGQKNRKQWKGISDGTSTVLNTMSPIPLSEDNENGITVDSYYHPDVSVFKQGKVEASRADLPKAAPEMGEAFAKPQMPVTTKVNSVKNSCEDMTSTKIVSPRTCVTEQGNFMGRVKCPQGDAIQRVDQTALLGNATYQIAGSATPMTPSRLEATQSIGRARAASPPALSAQDAERGRLLSEASPNTMLNESLSLISRMKIQNCCSGGEEESGSGETASTSPVEANASLSCSIISQGLGLVSPDSFMEDMRNASMSSHHQGERDEPSSTSTPNLTSNRSNTPCRPRGMRENLVKKNMHTALDTLPVLSSGGDSRSRSPAGKFNPVHKPFSSRHKKQDDTKVSAAVKKGVKSDRDAVGRDRTGLRKGQPSVRKERGELGSKPFTQLKSHGGKKQSPPSKNLPKKSAKEPRVKNLKEEPIKNKPDFICHVSESNSNEPTAFDSDLKQSSLDSLSAVESGSTESSCVFKEQGRGKAKYFPDIFEDLPEETRCLEPDDDKRIQDTNMECKEKAKQLLSPTKSKYDRAVEAAERSLSPRRQFFPMSPNNLPTSPSQALSDLGRRGTMTVTKSRPSEALLAAMNNRKRLFDEASKPSESHGDDLVVEGDCEIQENVEVTVEETYQKRNGRMFVVVKETTCMTKSTTDTYVEEVPEGHVVDELSPGQFRTPTKQLPNSPNPELSRRSTHVLRSPKVIDRLAVDARRLDFGERNVESRSDTVANLESISEDMVAGSKGIDNNEADCKIVSSQSLFLAKTGESVHIKESNIYDKETSSFQETAPCACANKTRSDTFEKEASTLIISHNKTSSDTFEKEELVDPTVPNVDETHLRQDGPVQSSIRLDKSNDESVSGDGGSVGNITKDSLDITAHLEDSLEKSQLPCNEEQNNPALQGDELSVTTKACEVNTEVDCRIVSRAEDPAVFPEGGEELAKGPEEAKSLESDDDEQFYDTQSQRYYDALSDTINNDLDEDVLKVCATVESCIADDVECMGQELEQTELELADPCTSHTTLTDNTLQHSFAGDACVNADAKCKAWLEAEIDRKEEIMTCHREILSGCHRPAAQMAVVTSAPLVKHSQAGKEKKRLRRSLSAHQLQLPVTEVKEESGEREAPAPVFGPRESHASTFEQMKPGVQVATVQKPVQQSKFEAFVKPAAAQPRTLRGRAAQPAQETRPRSQSLTNLQKLKAEVNKKPEARVATAAKSFAKSDSSTKQKRLQKGVAQSKLILVKSQKSAAPRHPMRFVARNMYYDERWAEKQERGFVHWLNFVLTPPDEYVTVTNKTKVNAGSLSLDSHQVAPRLAPTKEVLSFRSYAAYRRLNKLRRQACHMYQSEPVVAVIRKVEVAVESRRIAMRVDKMVHADLGIKQCLLDLLLQYSSLWLRIGLEAVFGEVLMVQSNQDVVGMSRFIVTRLLSSPDIAAEFAHPTVPHLYREGYAAAVSRHTLKKFLLLVYFLDFAKTSRLIDHDPCLFCKDAEIKSSKEILVQFSREVLSGEGDITKHLAYLGYTVGQKQQPIDEFNFAVKTLSTDLRDGLRLSRVLEFMAGEQGIMGRLRVPAISRLQKIHNVEEFFKASSKQGLDLSVSGVSARDVVDGHREKTLALLWRLILHFQSSIQVNVEQLQEEISLLTKSLKLKVAMQKIGAITAADGKASRDSGAGETSLMKDDSRLQLIFQWCRLVCLHYGVKVENFSVGFSDGRALCCLLHHYHPALLPLDQVSMRTSVSLQEEAEDREAREEAARGDDSGADTSLDWGTGGSLLSAENDPELFDQLLANEKSNFKVLYEKVSALGGVPLMLRSTDMSNTIPDEKVVSTYVAYLCARLLDIREEVRAARILQMAWRRRLLRRAVRERQRKTAAAVTIQRWIRPQLAARLEHKRQKAATDIQAFVRGWLAKQEVMRLRKQCEEEMENRKLAQAAVVLQKFWRGRRERKEFLRMKREVEMTVAAVVFQKMWRGREGRRKVERLRAEKEEQKEVMMREKAALAIQSAWRGQSARREVQTLRINLEKKRVEREQTRAAVSLQSLWRARQARCELQRLKVEAARDRAALALQRMFRGVWCRKELRRQRTAAIAIQTAWRGRQARCELETLKQERRQRAATVVGSAARGFLCRRKFLETKRACLVFQKTWRSIMAKRELERLKSERDAKAVTLIQATLKGFLVRRCFVRQRKAAVLLQSSWRRALAMKQLAELKQQRNNRVSMVIAKSLKGYVARKRYVAQKKATIAIQSFWRMHVAQKELAKLKQTRDKVCATLVQKVMKGFVQRQKYLQLRSAAIVLQCAWRCKKAREGLEVLRAQHRDRASLTIQKNVKAHFARQRYLKIRLSAVTLQKNWRVVMAKRQVDRMRFERREQASVVLQKHYRAFQARSNFLAIKSSAVIIQKNWRMVQAKKQVDKMKFERREQASTVLQKYCRAFQARSNFTAMKSSAIVIQKSWRMVQARALVENMRCQRKNQAAIVIQKIWRGFSARKYYRDLKKAAICVQSFWRMRLFRHQFTQKKAAAITVQNRYRANIQAKQQRSVYLSQKRAAVCIQSAWRGKRQREVFVKTRQAAVVIQSNFKGYRRRIKFLALRLACVIIQRRYRAYKNGRRQRDAYVKQCKAAVLIQRQFRQVQRQRVVQRQTAAALLLQTLWRKRHAKRSFKALKAAAILIQTRFREYHSAKVCLEEYLRKKNAAKVIQAGFRCYILKRNCAKYVSCIVKVQACIRGRQARLAFNRKLAAVLTIQRKFRAARLARVFRQAFLLIKSSATNIQRFYRAVRERRVVQQEFTTMKMSAIVIQARYRSWSCRRKYLSMRQGVVCLQQRFRAHKAGREAQDKYEKTKQAICVIQTWWRKSVEIREARQELEERRRQLQREKEENMRQEAAVVIQAYVRGYRARQSYACTMSSVVLLQRKMKAWVCRRRFETIRLAAAIVQKRWREVVEGRKLRKDFLQLRHAAVVLQSVVRMRADRRLFVNYVRCVTLAQAQVKMVTHRHKFQHLREKTVFLQRRVRAQQAMQMQRARFLRLRENAIKIQSLVRGWSARCQLRRTKAAVKIQSYWRMHQQRVAFTEALEAAQVLKSFMIRKHRQLAEARARQDAAVVIQQAFRLFICRKEAQRLNAACTIQRAFRSFVCRREAERCNAALVIQQAFRSFVCHREARRHQSACIIQRAFRSFVCRREARRYQSACIIQQAFRSFICRREAQRYQAACVIQCWFRKLQRKLRMAAHERLVRSVVLVQSAVRMFLERKRYLAIRRSAVLLQAMLRGCRAREMTGALKARHRAAVKLQAVARGFLVRRRVGPVLEERIRVVQEHRVLHKSCTKIQALWRGYIVRRDNKSRKLVQARKRLEEANRSATEEKTLGSRTASALDYLLRERDLAFILESLMHLDTSTRLSSVCCERLVQVNAVGVLYRLINSCNRSLPHMEIIKYSISILLNLAKYERTVHAVLEVSEALATILDLMQIYREKGAIFIHCCMLLGVLALAPGLGMHIHHHPGLTERLQGIHRLVLRKHKATQTRQTALSKMAAMHSSFNCTIPALTPSKSRQRRPKVRPCWSLARDGMRDFEDSVTGINFVLDVLQIGPK